MDSLFLRCIYVQVDSSSDGHFIVLRTYLVYWHRAFMHHAYSLSWVIVNGGLGDRWNHQCIHLCPFPTRFWLWRMYSSSSNSNSSDSNKRMNQDYKFPTTIEPQLWSCNTWNSCSENITYILLLPYPHIQAETTTLIGLSEYKASTVSKGDLHYHKLTK